MRLQVSALWYKGEIDTTGTEREEIGMVKIAFRNVGSKNDKHNERGAREHEHILSWF